MYFTQNSAPNTIATKYNEVSAKKRLGLIKETIKAPHYIRCKIDQHG
jgi:hypothetical protein